MQAELFSWGAAEEVTGSKHFLRIKDELLMVDCGAFQGHREETEQKNREWKFDAATVDAVLLTHAHYDHSGLLPLLTQKGFTGNIYATPATRDLANLVMMDSAHIQAKDIEWLAKRARRKNEVFDKVPLYDEQDVVKVLDHFITVSYGRPFPVTPSTKATFFDAGHILGSSLCVVDVDYHGHKMRVGFTGDLGRNNLPILRDPQDIPSVDYLVMESTYGNRLHDPIASAKDELAKAINRTVKRGGKIIIPAFAIERTQELVYFINMLNQEGAIPDIPVYVDSPMATNATSIFRVHQECYDTETQETFLANHKNPFGFDDLRYITNVEESKALNMSKDPCIIISSSGMCEAGRVLHHLLNNIENPKNTVLIVGYMAENTLGRRIQDKDAEVKIFGDMYKLRAEVLTLNTFSAHADYNDILIYVNKLDRQRLKKVFLVHGEPKAQTNLKGLLEDAKISTTIVKAGEVYPLLTAS
ncbi:MAG: MBL fold metallo-hydrolase [Deltaproteobacteria bacterium RIFOXYB12_FULL_58_9]|nr:MAG: MBL fold metallo-hydrolase [Deltaproteobacteria bacterium RIFOXYB12_FULL_58_9]